MKNGDSRYGIYSIPLLILLLVGCAGAGPIVPSGVLPIRENRISNVPFYSQETGECGPAALAEVLSFHGVAVTPHEVSQEVFRDNLGGTVTLDMLLYPRRKGFRAISYAGGIDDIGKAIDAGIPLIVMVDLGRGGISRFHFMTVIGYGPDGVIVHSGESREERLSWGRFLRDWEKTGRWSLRIEPQS